MTFRGRASRRPQESGCVNRDDLPAGSAHRRVKGVAGPKSFTAALASAVAGIDRVRPIAMSLDRSFVFIEKAIANGETADLIKMDALAGHAVTPLDAVVRSRSRFSAVARNAESRACERVRDRRPPDRGRGT